jgi:hypothetical protein
MTEKDTAVPRLYEMISDLTSVVCVTAYLIAVSTELSGKEKLLYDIFSDVKACEERCIMLCCCVNVLLNKILATVFLADSFLIFHLTRVISRH